MKGDAWEQLKSQAMISAGRPDLSNNRQKNNVYVLAKALIYARCLLESSDPQCSDIDLQKLHTEVVDQIMMIIGTEKGGSTLALGRELAAYVIAADLVTLPAKEGTIFKAWLRNVRNSRPDSNKKKTLISTHEERPNNWGTHAGASRIAIAAYLNDVADIRRSATVFKGWLGDREAYAGFRYRYGFSWQCHADKPVGINPPAVPKMVIQSMVCYPMINVVEAVFTGLHQRKIMFMKHYRERLYRQSYYNDWDMMPSIGSIRLY